MPAAALCVEARLRNDWIDGVGPEVEREIEQGERLTRCAAELGGDDATTRATAGFVLVRVAGHQDDGAAFIERALNLNVNLARAWLHSAWVRIWLGEPERAIRHHQGDAVQPPRPLAVRRQSRSHTSFWRGTTRRHFGRRRPCVTDHTSNRHCACRRQSHALAGRSERRWKSWVGCDRSIPVCALPT